KSYKTLSIYKVNYDLVKNFLVDEIENIVMVLIESHQKQTFNSLYHNNLDFLQKILKHSLFLMTEEFLVLNSQYLNSNEKYSTDFISLEIILKNIHKLLVFFTQILPNIDTSMTIFE